MGCVCISPIFCLDDSNKEGNQTINDGQTGFSGSTGSYSDILASNSNSRPATANQSRPASSVKLSRPTSALARPSSAVDQEADQDITEEVATPDQKAESNIDEIDDAPKAAPSVTHSEVSKTIDVVEGKGNDVKLPVKVVEKVDKVQPSEVAKNATEAIDKGSKVNNVRRPSVAKEEVKKQPVPKVGKSVNERKTVGRHAAPGRGVPPKLSKPMDNKAGNKSEKNEPEKASLNKTVLEGEGLLENISETVSKLDPVSGDGHMEGEDNTGTLLIGIILIKGILKKKTVCKFLNRS